MRDAKIKHAVIGLRDLRRRRRIRARNVERVGEFLNAGNTEIGRGEVHFPEAGQGEVGVGAFRQRKVGDRVIELEIDCRRFQLVLFVLIGLRGGGERRAHG